jgi:hypothetical protein
VSLLSAPAQSEEAAVLAAVRNGDEGAFAAALLAAFDLPPTL